MNVFSYMLRDCHGMCVIYIFLNSTLFLDDHLKWIMIDYQIGHLINKILSIYIYMYMSLHLYDLVDDINCSMLSSRALMDSVL